MGNIIYNIFTNSLNLGLIYAVLGLGVFISFRILDIADLGTEGVFPLGGALSILLLTLDVPPILVLIITMIAGAIMGLVTSILHTKLKIPPLLAGIITMVLCIPIAQLLNGLTTSSLGYDNPGSFVGLVNLTSQKQMFYTFFVRFMGEWGYILTTFLTVLVVIALLYWFFGTEIGISLRATGHNKIMSQAQSLNTDRRVILGLMLSNGLVALSGSLFSQFMRTANSTFGQGTIVIALASILLGEAIFFFKNQHFALKLTSVLVGAFSYQLIINIAMRVLNNNGYLKIVQAVFFALILCIPLIKKGFFKRRLKTTNKEVENHA